MHHVQLRQNGHDEPDMDAYKLGHPQPCNDGACRSKLRILRAASVHYPLLRKLLENIYKAQSCHYSVKRLDQALHAANFSILCKLVGIQEYTDLIDSPEIFLNEGTDRDTEAALLSTEGLRHIETQLQVQYAAAIEEYSNKLKDDPEHACVSCHRLFVKNGVTKFKYDAGKFKSDVWQTLKNFMIESDPDVRDKILYVCQYCRTRLNENQLPNRCILNGLLTEPIPPEVSSLNILERQLIQKAKAFQTIIRLGTHTGKVPIYSATRALKGTSFFLPMPFDKTLDLLDSIEAPQDLASEVYSILPDPHIFILLDGKPTKDKVVWQSMVDVDNVKGAVKRLKEINWLYKNIDEACIGDAAKKISYEAVGNTSSKLLEKATEQDMLALDHFTIRQISESMPIKSDIDHYKLLTVSEPCLDNRLKYLDVMCFPSLFPTGEYGQHHPREVKLSFAEYIKSRLLNEDSRFRKSPEFIFYCLWQKELKELSTGICNLMKRLGKQGVSAKQLLQKIECNDNELELNLTTMMQSVRGTKQFWFLKKSELQCMVREYGAPTLFLTFSCAEYDSKDISTYLHKVNSVPFNYPIGKLCAEDPLSVSRKFSKKFHDFFQTVLIKGEALGKVAHFYWKKEYQSRGAPHYHVLVWIEGAPVIGIDPDEHVLNFIQKHITCRIPDQTTNPELYRLVTKYQMHKCSKYCKRKKKIGGVFVTKCKFAFPRLEAEEARLNPVEESLKGRNKIYTLSRSASEIRINDYNPLLLYLWQANMDIQFVSESSLALANYVTGYITKAEKSHMQEIFECTDDAKSSFSRLFSFGVRSLRSRECGLYEASDILLGDHLLEKSDTVQWVAADQPHKRKRRLKNHEKLRELAENDPDCTEVFENNLIDNFYPNRPMHLESVCLYDFVKWYTYSGIDGAGSRTYRKLNKPRLPNHRLYDVNKENEKEDYFYSLLLLFVPFRNESDLIGKDQSAENAFNNFIASNNDLGQHHEKLCKMLQAQIRVNKINDHRNCEEEQSLKEDSTDEPTGLEVAGEAKAAMHDVHEMEEISMDDDTLKDKIEMLKGDQRRVFDMVNNHLLHQKSHELGECDCTNRNPFQLFLSGVGGTGKSFLIDTIRHQVAAIWKDDNSGDAKCVVAAPTGLAAHNVGGVTLHRLFQLPIEHQGKTAEYWPLSKEARKTMRMTLRSIKLVVVDEVSMVSNLTLAYIHLRLDELFGGLHPHQRSWGSDDDWFASINILFVGDLLQLPPVNGLPAFSRLNNQTIASRLGCITSLNIWKDCITYDELTINQRQKDDPVYTKVLHEVRQGCPSKATLDILAKRVINETVTETFQKLSESGSSPVCLFPTCKACEDHNKQMLDTLNAKLETLYCSDEIDETRGTRKWSKAVTDQIKKLNKDCNLTAGLEAELTIAIGARVMLRRNIDTKKGLVNGSIGTVTAITTQHVMIKFDRINEPCAIERVRSKFMVKKSFFVYRKQFPLILAFAVTIHKCQGLSLDCAIIDLSKKVFSPGMAYVALSRVRSLNGVYLTDFDPASIIVSSKCLEEVNRLRSEFRKDLGVYEIPIKQKKCATKRKLAASFDVDGPPLKISNTKGVKRKQKLAKKPPTKRTKLDMSEKSKEHITSINKDCVVVNEQNALSRSTTIWPHFRYYQVSEQWQRSICTAMPLLQFRSCFVCSPGGSDIPLTRPNLRKLRTIEGDGNCMFRALSYIITGSEDQHHKIRSLIVSHMLSISNLLIGHGPDGRANYANSMQRHSSIEEYIRVTKMDRDTTWGTAIELACASHLFNTPLYVYDVSHANHTWVAYFPSLIDRRLQRDVNCMSMYIYYTGCHFNVVSAVRVS